MLRAKISRREFLKLLAMVTGVGGATLARWLASPSLRALSLDASPNSYYMPIVEKEIEPTPVLPSTNSRVVQVRDTGAVTWNAITPPFWQHIDQSAVDAMFDAGLKALTGARSVAGAWNVLLPNYQPGQPIAVKVNFNNSTYCSDVEHQIDAVIEPVNALVRGLLERGVLASDIWVYDAIRSLPDRFVSRSRHNGIKFYDNGCRTPSTWVSNHANAIVKFNPPDGVIINSNIRVSDVLINARYLINMPIMKIHGLAGVSLGFKNHFGSVNMPWEIHPTSELNNATYRSSYSPLVDLFKNQHIGLKTVLTVGDGLFGAFGLADAPKTWKTFGNGFPCSLFFSTDPVAIDCVMADYLRAEGAVTSVNFREKAYDYLRLADSAHLGVFERGNPAVNDYQSIELLKITM